MELQFAHRSGCCWPPFSRSCCWSPGRWRAGWRSCSKAGCRAGLRRWSRWNGRSTASPASMPALAWAGAPMRLH